MKCCLHELGGCDTAPQGHHLIARHRLKTQHRSANVDRPDTPWHPLSEVTLTGLLADERNIFALCWAHHQLVHSGAGGVTSRAVRTREAFAQVVAGRRLQGLRTFAQDFWLESQLEHALAPLRLLASSGSSQTQPSQEDP